MNYTHITNNEIEQAQRAWAEGLVEIGRIYINQGDYLQAAQHLVTQLYAYNHEHRVVLFKPTMTREIPFRNTLEGAVSYFVGNNPKFKEDRGFALAPWKQIEFDNHAIYRHHNTATVMGTYHFTNNAEEKTTVLYTLGYIRSNESQLKIFLHHSSLPPKERA